MKQVELDRVVNRLLESCHEALADLRKYNDDQYWWILSGLCRSIYIISVYDSRYQPQYKIANNLQSEGIYYKIIDAFLEDYEPRTRP